MDVLRGLLFVAGTRRRKVTLSRSDFFKPNLLVDKKLAGVRLFYEIHPCISPFGPSRAPAAGRRPPGAGRYGCSLWFPTILCLLSLAVDHIYGINMEQL